MDPNGYYPTRINQSSMTMRDAISSRTMRDALSERAIQHTQISYPYVLTSPNSSYLKYAYSGYQSSSSPSHSYALSQTNSYHEYVGTDVPRIAIDTAFCSIYISMETNVIYNYRATEKESYRIVTNYRG